MARPTSGQSRPGRTLLLLLALILAMGGGMILQQAFIPKLGLDLAGGTTVTLSPLTPDNRPPSQESLDLAVNIIRDRVNGSGISDAQVAKSGDNIVISVPGAGREEVIKLVGTTAELRFRQVLAEAPAVIPPAAIPTTAPTPSGSASPSASPTSRSSRPAATPSATAKPEASASPPGRAVSSGLASPTSPSAAPSPSPSGEPSPRTARARATSSPSPTPSAPTAPVDQQDPLAGVDTTGIDPAVIQQFRDLKCEAKDRGQGLQDDPAKQIAACSKDGAARYILDKAAVTGTQINSASSGLADTTGEWIVQLDFKSQGANEWSKITTTAFNSQAPRNQVAMVLDGLVISAPVIQEPIPGGRAQISGGFNQQTSTDLANQLKYGALPLKFVQSSVVSVSSTLGADQLTGGLIAGGIGLILVVIYSMLYYRGLGLVSVFSLAVAALLTYQSVVLLGHNAGFRLSLPHIIGLVVSIGITADSFIVFFERIRDEMKEGRRSLRSAVEVAWVRARRTILVADAVMFIAAVVLYFLSVGDVAGFAFAMGLTTLIDVVLVFMFTKPLVTLLARLKFFSKGHKLSGLDAERMSETTVRTSTPQEA
ncbi:protein translocase subunit SecD [Sinosporangium siamense]|uniref:Protein translocase subunit SecD n=1 Tax=Sinosporangium siamense TaxID=1367973 RepID=A0A919V9I1_9ACTN|nr:protein translocase subunit SecD [Sinosporangium siamense]GII95326.1 protein translocase subunit SecD [Sinosporangium siamense]